MDVDAWIESVDILHNFLFQRYPPSVATLLVENINSSSLLEIQDNKNVSGSAYKNLSEWKYLAERQR